MEPVVDTAVRVRVPLLLLRIGVFIVMLMWTLELAILLLFVSGLAKRFSYGAVLALHAVSTLSSYRQYLGFDNLLFFAAWPMLAACIALYLLRDLDTLAVLPALNGHHDTPTLTTGKGDAR